MTALLTAGCATQPIPTPSDDTPSVSRPVRSADAYYYYLAALKLERDNQKADAVEMMARAIAEDPWAPQLLLSRASMLVDLNRLNGAMADLARVLAAHPDHSEALIMVGGIERARKRLAQAADAYARAIRANPDKARIYLLLAETYNLMGRPKQAGDTYTELVQRFPKNVAGLIYLGRWHLIYGSSKSGEAYLKRAEFLRGDLESPHALLGRLYDDSKRYEEAITQYEAVLDINPENISAAFRLALMYIRTGRKEPAQKLLGELGLSAKDDDRVVSILVEEYLDTNAHSDGRTLLTGMLDGAPDNDLLQYLTGVAEEALERPDAALGHLSRIDTGSRLFLDATIRMARILKATGQTQKGIADARKAIAAAPDQPMRYFQLAVLHESIEQYDESLAAIATGLKHFPGHIQLLYRKGLILERRSDRDGAMDAMREVIVRDPKHADALNFLGYAYAEMGTRLDEAETLIKTALSIKPKAGYIIDSLGWVFFQQGRYKDALPLFHRAIELEGNDPTILEHLGDTLVKMKKWKNALDYYRQSRDLHRTARDRQRVIDKMTPLESLNQ